MRKALRRFYLFVSAAALCVVGIQQFSFWAPVLRARVGRHAIGSLVGQSTCRSSIREVAITWLSDPPRFPERDDLQVPFVNVFSPYRAPASLWPFALLAKGVIVDYGESRDPRALQSLRKAMDRFVRDDGALNFPLRDLEDSALGEAFVFLHQTTGEAKYRAAADALASYLLERFNQQGVLTYSASRHERLVDSVGLMCPFLSLYGRTYGDRRATAFAARQITDFLKNGLEPRTHLPYHGYMDTGTHGPVGVPGWGRGTGWLLVGISDTATNLRETEFAPVLLDAGRTVATAAVGYRLGAGGWGTMLTVPDAPFDSSATAMIGYGIGRLRGLLPEIPSEDTAVRSLVSHVRRSGVVDFASGPLMDYNRHSFFYGPSLYVQGMALALVALSGPSSSVCF